MIRLQYKATIYCTINEHEAGTSVLNTPRWIACFANNLRQKAIKTLVALLFGYLVAQTVNS